MQTIAHGQLENRADTELRRFVVRYRAFVYVGMLLFAVVLSFADRRDSAGPARTTVAVASPEATVPADLDNRPLNLPDR